MQYDIMSYQTGMEEIGSDILRRVLAGCDAYEPGFFALSDVQTALGKDRLDIDDFGALLSSAAGDLLEETAVRAKAETARYFGNTIRLFTP